MKKRHSSGQKVDSHCPCHSHREERLNSVCWIKLWIWSFLLFVKAARKSFRWSLSGAHTSKLCLSFCLYSRLSAFHSFLRTFNLGTRIQLPPFNNVTGHFLVLNFVSYCVFVKKLRAEWFEGITSGHTTRHQFLFCAPLSGHRDLQLSKIRASDKSLHSRIIWCYLCHLFCILADI